MERREGGIEKRDRGREECEIKEYERGRWRGERVE